MNLLERFRAFFRSPLAADPNFARVWLSAAISTLGAQVSIVALPLVAIQVLGASAWEMGMLAACELLPFALVSLPAGVWLDRRRKYPVVLWGEFVLAGLLLIVPTAAALGHLTFPLLAVVSFCVGTVMVVAGSAFQILLTHIAGRERLVEANAKITATNSIAGLAGPGLAAALIHWLSPPYAIVLDALCIVSSGLILWGIVVDEPPLEGERKSALHEIAEGLRQVWQEPVLRTLAWSIALWMVGYHGFMAIHILYATRELGLHAGFLGMALTTGAVGAALAAGAAKPLNRRLGLGNTILLGLTLAASTWLGFAAVPAGSHAVLALAALMFVLNFSITISFINYLSLRQAVTPDHLLGRVISTMRFLTVASAPLGSLMAGWLGDQAGLRPTLVALGIAGVALMAWVSLFSGVGKVRDLGDPAPPT
jgi:MFS family permease